MNNENPNDPHLNVEARQPRTTASNSQPKPTQCRRHDCGEPVQGRRRNGYCSDRCRMRDVRDAERCRRLDLLDALSATVEQLRREVLR